MCDTCAYKAILGANDPDTQEVFSKLVGTFDKQVKTSGANVGFGLPSWNSGTKPEDKRIIKPEEFATLNDIVLLTPYGFFRVNKKPYYVD